MKAKAEQHGLPFVELREIEIPASVIELVPESLARENIVMPLSQESGSIRVIMHDPLDFETIDKLRFVLEPRDRGLAGAQGSDRRGDQQILWQRHRPRPSRSTRCSRSSPTRRSTSPRMAATGGKSSTTNTLEEGDAPVIKLVHLIIQEAVHHARQRHPHRAVRRPGADPLPDRRRA